MKGKIGADPKGTSGLISSVAVDASLTGTGVTGSPLSVVDQWTAGMASAVANALDAAGLNNNAGKLKRVDTGAWEAARRSNGVITAVADAGGGVCTVTATAHGQADGATVTIAGTTDYNGSYTIANVTTDTFDITETFTSSQTGTFTAENIYWVPDHERDGDWPVGTRPKRRFYKGAPAGATTTLWASFPHVLIRARGFAHSTDIPADYPIPSYSVSSTLLRVEKDVSGNLIYRAGSDFYGKANDSYIITVDYYEP